ncbi:MAG: UDP-N-acetylmuramoyl-L-alanyl-D-glutamate--2,6-diaminopimelate ligase [Lachnospiraceae bacterium]|nr:UDP-N-acetylmuramoyl-L-alanyl-D-glutamate--2,6-diaminopimelate ligase [Lachnospiraceae bacterium]
MTIGELLKGMTYTVIREGAEYWQEREITSLIYDSRKVVPGCAFACERGTVYDGVDFLNMAAEKGALLAVMDKEPAQLPEGLTMLMVPDVMEAESCMAANFFSGVFTHEEEGKESEKIRMIGMTGTNGKTTTSTLMHHIFMENGICCGLVGTNENRLGDRKEPATHTTPYPFDLYPLFDRMKRAGAKAVVMEVSSHALAQHRVSRVRYDLGMFTNLTEDHLDFHKTMKAYLEAKCKLFYQSERGLVNGDDPAAAVILATKACPFFTYGLQEGNDYRAENMSMDENGLVYDWTFRGEHLGQVRYPVPGRFNIYNTLLAASACHLCGISPESIVKSLNLDHTIVDGRFETFRSRDGVIAVVDYAHTPDGLKNVLETAREFARGRIITVVGCGGDRDPVKRPIMGEIAGRLSDYCVLTSDNPRTEDPEKIIDRVEDGTRPTGCPYIRTADRREAIRLAIAMARPSDIVMVAGKGHEDYQIIGRTKIHLDDREEVTARLAER